MGRSLVAALLFGLAARPALAQEKPQPEPEKNAPAREKSAPDAKAPGQEKLPPGRTVIQAGAAIARREEGVAVIVTFLTGGVVIKRSDLEITCSRALLWTEAGKQSFSELYAEGGVIFSREKQTLRCEQFYLDMRDAEVPRAMIMDFRGEAASSRYHEKFYVRAREAKMEIRGRLEAKEISLTTCSYGVPHYHVTIQEGTLVGHGERFPKGPADFWPYETATLEGVDVYAELLGAPLLFIPAVALGPALAEFPLRHVEGGHNSRFGYYALSDWGIKLRKADEEGKWRPWAEVNLEADWREFRGGGFGFNTEYKWKNYQGYMKTYYLHDLGRDPSLGYNSKFGPLVYDDRGFAHLYHRQEISEHWRLELESYYVPDRDLREEFFPKEFREDKEPETAAFLRWVDGPAGAFLYERYRLNNWQTQVEYLPRADFSAFQVPIARGPLADLYLSQRLDGGRLRLVSDDELDLPNEETWRVDSTTEVSLPVDCRYFQVAPFAQERLTYYSDDVTGDDALRSIPSAGVRVSTQVHATFPDVQWELVGLRGLRHVVEFEARYAAAWNHSVQPSEVVPMDDVDRLSSFEEVELGMHHRFKTRDEAGKPFEFLSVGVEVEYYPNPRRDTTSVREDNYLPPFNYIMVSPESSGALPERHWSNVHYGMTFQPRKYFQLSGLGEYNPAAGVEEVRETLLTVWPWEKASLSIGQTYVRGITNAYTGSVSTELTEKWTVSVQMQYEFRGNEFLSQRLVVSRDFHDFLLEGVAENNTTTNEHRVYVAFVPKFLGEKGEKHSHVARPLMPSPQYSNPQP